MAKRIRFTEHCKQSLIARTIEQSIVEEAISQPDAVESSEKNRIIFTKKYFDANLQQAMVVRAVVEEGSVELVVITAYKSSHTTHYLKHGEKP